MPAAAPRLTKATGARLPESRGGSGPGSSLGPTRTAHSNPHPAHRVTPQSSTHWATPTPPTDTPAQRKPHRAPGSVPPGDEGNGGGGHSPSPFALQWAWRHEVGHSPPPPEVPSCSPPSTSIGCEISEGQSHPQDYTLNPKNLPPGLPTAGEALNDWQHPRSRALLTWVLGPSRGDPVSPRLGVGEDVIRGVTPHPGN